MIIYSINETNTKNSIREEKQKEEKMMKAILLKYPNYYSLGLRERMKIRDEFRR